MPLATIAPIIGGGLAAAGGVAAAVIGSHSAGKAADAATQAANQNNALQRDIYDKNLTNETPWMTAGLGANSQITGLLNGDSSAFDKFRNSTNYNFLFDQGTNALNTNYALRGAQGSGAAGKALVNYGQGMAGNALSGYYGMLENQAQHGQAATNAVAGVGTNYANAVSSNNNNAATAQGAAAINQGNALSNGITGVASAFNQARGYTSSYSGPAPSNALYANVGNTIASNPGIF